MMNGDSVAAPPIQRLGNAVLLQGSAVDAVRYACEFAQRARRRNGLPDSAALTELLVTLQSMSLTGQPDTQHEPDHHTGDNWITTEEAAARMKCSPRTARRLAPRLGGRLTGKRWLIDRQAVTEHIQGRAA